MAGGVKHGDLTDHLLCTYHKQHFFFFLILFRCQRNPCISNVPTWSSWQVITTWKHLAQGSSPLPGAFDQASCLGGNSSVKLQGAVRLPHQAVTGLRKEESCSLNHLLPLGVLLCNLGFPTRTRLDEMRNAAPTLSPPGCFLGT